MAGRSEKGEKRDGIRGKLKVMHANSEMKRDYKRNGKRKKTMMTPGDQSAERWRKAVRKERKEMVLEGS